MTPWHLEPGHPNRLAPGKRVRHTMNPPMVFKDGELWAVFGTPGGDNQVQINLQVLTAMIDLGYDPQQAAEMPRWSQHAARPGGQLAARLPGRAQPGGALPRRGPGGARRPRPPGRRLGDLDGPCSVEIIRRDAATGMLLAGSDPRRDGWALAY